MENSIQELKAKDTWSTRPAALPRFGTTQVINIIIKDSTLLMVGMDDNRTQKYTSIMCIISLMNRQRADTQT